MRTPISTRSSRQDPDRAEALADGLAELLVAEYRRRNPRYPQHNQQGLTVMDGGGRTSMVEPLRGRHHLDDAPQSDAMLRNPSEMTVCARAVTEGTRDE